MAAFNKFNAFVEHLAEKVHNLGSDTLKVYLSNAAPSASSHSVKGDIAEITVANGYTAATVIVTGSSQTAGTYALTQSADVAWTASGGSFGPFQYAILYNDTPTSPADPLIGWWDYGSAISVNTGETFTVDMGTNILTLA